MIIKLDKLVIHACHIEQQLLFLSFFFSSPFFGLLVLKGVVTLGILEQN